ncbi:MAG: hypothetical protein IPM83_08210 [Ignavibacteria bacterium]|nr:hypothetical protein [Ignavibacteria bacterium]
MDTTYPLHCPMPNQSSVPQPSVSKVVPSAAVEFLQALQTATDVQLNFLQAVSQINQAVVNINFLINQ